MIWCFVNFMSSKSFLWKKFSNQISSNFIKYTDVQWKPEQIIIVKLEKGSSTWAYSTPFNWTELDSIQTIYVLKYSNLLYKNTHICSRVFKLFIKCKSNQCNQLLLCYVILCYVILCTLTFVNEIEKYKIKMKNFLKCYKLAINWCVKLFVNHYLGQFHRETPIINVSKMSRMSSEC